MENYKYQAISKNGVKVNGVIEAFNEIDAVERIKRDCPVVLKLECLHEKKQSDSILSMEIGGNKLDNKAFTLMCSQFAIILNAGLPIRRTCELIAAKITDKKLNKLLKEVADDIQGGRNLSSAFEERGKKFLPTIFIETLKAAEMSGKYAEAFQAMAEHFDKQSKITQKVKSAVAYPIFVLVIAVVVVAVLMVKVVPTFVSIFDSYGAELPTITKILIGMSNFFKNYGLVLIGLIVLIIVIYQIYSRTEQGSVNCAKLALKIPMLGPISQLNAASQFANNMSALLMAGISITKAIRVTSGIISNQYISGEIFKMAGKIEEGNSLGSSLRQNPVLPDILIDMVEVGEESGEMDETLHTISAYYDNELEVAIQSFLAKLEPTLLLVIAGIAGFIVVAIYMSMFQMYGIM